MKDILLEIKIAHIDKKKGEGEFFFLFWLGDLQRNSGYAPGRPFPRRQWGIFFKLIFESQRKQSQGFCCFLLNGRPLIPPSPAPHCLTRTLPGERLQLCSGFPSADPQERSGVAPLQLLSFSQLGLA